MKSVPEYVKCVLTGLHEDKTTWCGRKNVVEWSFQDPTHAALNAKKEGRLLICQQCTDELIKTVVNGTYYERD